MAERLTYTTVSQLRALFAARGIHPKKSLGQNFLVDPNLLRVVADALAPGPRDVVLEIGAGTGSLTEVLAGRCGRVIAVEKDEYLCRVAANSLADVANVELIARDVLDDSGAIAARVMKAVTDALSSGDCVSFKVVGDLPYSAATPIIEALTRTTPRPEMIVCTVQLEVAQRLVAVPGTKAYGYLSVLTQSRASIELVRKLPPWVYWPTPKIWSALIRLRPLADGNANDKLKLAASALFEQRRKTAVNALMKKGLAQSREAAEALLQRAGVSADRRADRLSVQEIAALAAHLDDNQPIKAENDATDK